MGYPKKITENNKKHFYYTGKNIHVWRICTLILLELIYGLNEIHLTILMEFVWNLIIGFLSSPRGKSNNKTNKAD